MSHKAAIEWCDRAKLGPFRAFIADFRGRRLGQFKRAARFAGVTFEEFCDRMDAGQKRCTKCKQWKMAELFGAEAGRWDGKAPKCTTCSNRTGRDAYETVAVDELAPLGPTRHAPRDGDKLQARRLINVDVKRGRRPNPNDFYCVLCGHKGSDRRHEYHHHMGYDAEHHYDVIPVCSACHHEEHGDG